MKIWNGARRFLAAKMPLIERIAKGISKGALASDAMRDALLAEKTILPAALTHTAAEVLEGPVAVVNVGTMVADGANAAARIAKGKGLDCRTVTSIVSAGAGSTTTVTLHAHGLSWPQAADAGGTVGVALRTLGDQVFCPIIEHKHPAPLSILPGTAEKAAGINTTQPEAAIEKATAKIAFLKRIRMRGPHSLRMMAMAADENLDFLAR